MEGALALVSHVLGIDSFFAGGAADAEKFCSHFDLDTQFGALVERIESLIPARGDKAPLPRGAKAADGEGKPLDLSNLALLEKAIAQADRSEEHTSELQSLMRISYAVFCLKTKNHI